MLRAVQSRPELRLSVWRAYMTANSLKDALAALPNRGDSWVSAIGKTLSLLGQIEAQTGVLFGGKKWFEVESEAYNYVQAKLPVAFLNRSPAIHSELEEPRGIGSKLKVYTTKNGNVLRIPLKREYDGQLVQDDCTVLAPGDEEFDLFLEEVWAGFDNQIFIDAPTGITRFWEITFKYRPLRPCDDDCIGRMDLIDRVERDFLHAKGRRQKRTWLLLGPLEQERLRLFST